jgi:hypothetical protein
MKRKILFFIGTTGALTLLVMGCYTNTGGSNPKASSSQARLNLPNWGIVIDANYDQKLDGVVPGYKIVTVALTNRSIDLIKLDQANDQWFVEDAVGKKLRGINSLRLRDPQTWTQLPNKVRDIIEYPGGVQIGYTQTFDLFFPQNVDLDHFRSISFYSAILKQNFDALSSTSMERAVPAPQDPNTESAEKYIPVHPSSGSAKKPKASSRYN